MTPRMFVLFTWILWDYTLDLSTELACGLTLLALLTSVIPYLPRSWHGRVYG